MRRAWTAKRENIQWPKVSISRHFIGDDTPLNSAVAELKEVEGHRVWAQVRAVHECGIFFIFLTQKFAFWCILVAKNGNMQQWKSCQQASRWLVFRSIIHAWYLYWKVNKTQQWTKALFIFKHDWSSVISETIFATVASRVGPGHCCYRIRPIRFLAGWCKRRPEPGLVYGFVRFSYFGFLCCVLFQLA